MCAWLIRAAARSMPGFDVTPAELITGIITPAGIFKPKELWAKRKQLGLCWLGRQSKGLRGGRLN